MTIQQGGERDSMWSFFSLPFMDYTKGKINLRRSKFC
jgi:hypothetical protein